MIERSSTRTTDTGWALIGTGRVSAQTVRALHATDGARAVTVLSRDADRGRAFASEYGLDGFHTSLGPLLDDERVRVVYVASPNGAHVEHVVAAARAGKHVLCEKPMANDIDGCRQMATACADAGVELGVGFQYRQHPAHAEMRALIREGAIGRPLVADASICLPPMDVPYWYQNAKLAEGGVIPMSGIHRLDLLAFLLDGPPRSVTASTRATGVTEGIENLAAAVLEFDRDVLATVRFAMDTPHGGDGLVVHGTKGSLWAVGTTTQWWGGGGGEVTLTAGTGSQRRQYEAVDLYQRQVESFLTLLRGVTSTVADAVDGATAVATASAIRQSVASRRHITVPPTGIKKRQVAA